MFVRGAALGSALARRGALLLSQGTGRMLRGLAPQPACVEASEQRRVRVAWCSDTKRPPTVSPLITTSLEDNPSPSADRRREKAGGLSRLSGAQKDPQQKRHQR